MANEHAISESHIKLVETATAGLPGEHSSYFRRLISAGYKGHVQGWVAGGSLYGLIGAALGAIVAIPLHFIVPGFTFAAIPILAGYGILKGAATFGEIGSHAAQLAEYAEMNERRRSLLDRLNETQSKEEASEIRRILSNDEIDKAPQKLIHWRTAIIGALIGAAVCGVAVYVGLGGIGLLSDATVAGFTKAITTLIGPILPDTMLTAAGGLQASIATVTSIVAAFGAAAGATIGLDRGWIRRWFDVTEGTVHERDYYEKMTQERVMEIARLQKIGTSQVRKQEQLLERTRPAAPAAAVDVSPIHPASQVSHVSETGRISEAYLRRENTPAV